LVAAGQSAVNQLGTCRHRAEYPAGRAPGQSRVDCSDSKSTWPGASIAFSWASTACSALTGPRVQQCSERLHAPRASFVIVGAGGHSTSPAQRLPMPCSLPGLTIMRQTPFCYPPVEPIAHPHACILFPLMDNPCEHEVSARLTETYTAFESRGETIVLDSGDTLTVVGSGTMDGEPKLLSPSLPSKEVHRRASRSLAARESFQKLHKEISP
jgi:hypothetical protein